MNSTINLPAVVIADLMGIILMLITLTDNIWRMGKPSRQNVALRTMILACATTCIADAICFLADGRPGILCFLAVFIANTWLFLMDLVLEISWFYFLLSFLNIEISHFHKRILFILNTIGLIILLVNCFYPVVFTVSEQNIYTRRPLYMYFIIMQSAFLVDSLIIYIKARRDSGFLKYFPVEVFLLPVFLGVLIQTFYYGVSTIWPFVSIAVCGVSFSLQNELLYRDKLTGLYNRFYLDNISKRLSTHPELNFSLMLLDLNNFKAINDRYGHTTGDEALLETGKRICNAVESHGEVIRYAGDQFIALLNTQDEAVIQSITEKINRSMEDFSLTGETRYQLSLSIGYSKFSFNTHNIDEMINLADKRMFENKRAYYISHPDSVQRNRLGEISESSQLMNAETQSIVLKLERDPVTQAYTKSFFYEYVDRELSENAGVHYDMICVEVKSYELLYGRFGLTFCNSFMKTFVDSINCLLPESLIVGRISDNQIGFLTPHMSIALHRSFLKQCLSRLEASPSSPQLELKCGVYLNVDRSLSAEAIFNNACLPIEAIRFNATENLAEFDETFQSSVSRRQILTNDMYQALETNQFVTYYQPKFNAQTKEINGAEALVRWIHPTLGMINPGDFIPLFEHNGFIEKLDKHVLTTVCQNIRQWLDLGYHPVPISINISQIDFDQNDLAESLEQIVDLYQIPHELIHFEITESINALDYNKKLYVVNKLREKKFRIELDDFGTGYSTLNALGDLPIDVLKVDRYLIENLNDEKYQTILRATLYAAHGMKIPVVIEGVENQEQIDLLTEMCKERINITVQGFYYSKPVKKQQYESLIF
ncbi:MAG: EAL domain-containing protein [Blautia sp.]|nr:EAL domain-containing protein [Blautia sp.]